MADKNPRLLGYYTVSISKYWPTFQRSILPPSSRPST